jgi:hypothetical protein
VRVGCSVRDLSVRPACICSGERFREGAKVGCKRGARAEALGRGAVVRIVSDPPVCNAPCGSARGEYVCGRSGVQLFR